MIFCRGLLLPVLVALVVQLFSASDAHANVSIRERHIVMIYPGLDALWGNYIFMLSNTSDSPVLHSMPLLMPKETVDWQASQAIAPDEVKLMDDGSVQLVKELPPGNHLLSIGFKVPASGGSASFTLVPGIDMDMLAVFLPHDSQLSFEASGFKKQENFPFSGKVYDSYSMIGATKGTVYKAKIHGVAEGRADYWNLGWVIAAILVVGGGISAYLTKPAIPAEGSESEVVG